MNTKLRATVVLVILALTTYELGKRNQLDNSDYYDGGGVGLDIPMAVEVDDRVVAVEEFYGKYNCPLKEYSEEFIEVADKYDLDFRLLVAISFIESTGGKFQKGNNPFGFLYRSFESFGEAIEYVGRAIAGKSEHRAWREGMTTEEILWVYNGTVNPNYPAKVVRVMEEIYDSQNR